MKDDIYQGFFIPAGATVMGNIWYAIRFHGTFPTVGYMLSTDAGKGNVL